MAFRTVLILWFGAGFMLEALYLVRRNPKWTQLAGCAGLGLVIAAIAHLKHPDGDPFMYVGIGLGMSGVALAMFYQDEILPPVGAKLLLAFTLIFWFGFVADLYHGTQLQLLLAFAGLLPTAAVVYVAWVRPALGFWGKLGLYTWYLVIIVFLGCLQFPFGNLSIFHDGSALGWLGPIDAFATGMASLYLLTNAYYLSELLPIPGRNQSFSDRMKDWHELTDLMTQRCSDQDGPAEGPAFAIIGALGLLLLLNYVLELLPNSLVISAAIILAAVLLERAPIRETLGTGSAV
jgi:hypothetical protein